MDPVAFSRSCGVDQVFFPPESLLSFLQVLANRADATLLYYACSMWGGDIESDIPTPFFTPHTRAFPWQSYRLDRQPA